MDSGSLMGQKIPSDGKARNSFFILNHVLSESLLKDGVKASLDWCVYSFFRSCKQYLLNVSCVLVNILGSRNTWVNKESPCPQEGYILVGGANHKQTIYSK